MKTIIWMLMLLVIAVSSKAQIWGENNSRTEYRNDAGLQGNAGAQSGFFQTVSPVNYPSGANGWWHLLDIRHGNVTNNYAMQFAGSFFDQELFFRKTNGVASQQWSKLWHSSNLNTPLRQWRSYIGSDITGTLNEMPANTTVFSYMSDTKGCTTNAPTTGPAVHFAGFEDGNYGFQLQSNSGNGEIYTRSKNGDINKWTDWRKIVTENTNGSTYLNGSLVISRQDSRNPNPNIHLNSADKNFLYLMTSAGSNNYNGIIRDGDHAIIFSNGVTSTGALTIAPWAPTTSGMRIDNNGNVSIGVSNSHGYSLAVNGPAVFAKAVVKNYSNWPDFVFDSSYNLPSLESVSSFVKENKCLPEMPSAYAIEKDGHDLGEVQKLLLKKVEEMTLYILQLKQENEDAKKRIEILEAVLNKK